MEDWPVIDETCFSGLKLNKAGADEPIFFTIKIEPEQKEAFCECIEKVKPMSFNDMGFAALGLYLTKIYSDHYTTE